MSTSASNITEVLEMNTNLKEYSKSTENTLTEDECDDRLCDTSDTDTLQSQTMEDEDENTDKKNSKAKKRNRSEKQKQRVRDYRKKIRKAKRQQMAVERKMSKISTESDDVFCILAVYADSSLHVEYDKEYRNNTRTHTHYGYEYFSMSDFLK